jgi:glycosyltransferase involved in cell wall biosynthesis
MSPFHPPIRVLHVTPSLDPAVGTGPAVVLAELATEQRRQGLEVTVVTVDPPGAAEQVTGPMRGLGIGVHLTGPRRGPLKKGAASRVTVRRVLRAGVDLVHVHAMWLHLPHCAAAEARRHNTPYVFSPHGMLEPWALRKSALRKRLFLWARGRRDLEGAAAIHATAGMEARNIAALGLRNPVLVAPVGVDLARYAVSGGRERVDSRWPALAGKRLVLFMGRIDPVKGTLNLARAWGALASEFPGWRLAIAGADWHGHKAEFLAALAAHGGGAEFLGPVYGEDKSALLASCDLLVQPSFQENFGITIAESLASARPVITTRGTPWGVLETRGAGWWIEIGAAPLGAAMRDAMSRSRPELDEMGRRGRALIEEHFTWPMITRTMTSMYGWLLGRNSLPPGVYRPGEAIPD